MKKILTPGFYAPPAGNLAAIVTCLEMRKPPPIRAERGQTDMKLRSWQNPQAKDYQDLFRKIGTDWLWFSRLILSDKELTTIIHNPKVEIYQVVTKSGTGMLELDFRQDSECELAFFGLTHELQGQGAGRWLMNRAIELAWAKPIKRFWVHTCSMDHPNALDFYCRSGFTPYQRQIEIAPDPRLTGILPATAAPHIPLIKD